MSQKDGVRDEILRRPSERIVRYGRVGSVLLHRGGRRRRNAHRAVLRPLLGNRQSQRLPRQVGCELWSDDPEFEEQLGDHGVTGICGSGIIEAVACMYLAGIIRQDGVIKGESAARSERIIQTDRTFSYLLHDGEPRICIEQNDVRAIQLAKAALYAGARLLMDRMGVEKVDRIRLAGAFGSHIDVKYAMVLGMIPDCALDQVSSAQNAAGTGARIALLSKASRKEIEQRTKEIEKIETAIDENFQRHFVEAMGIPHTTHEFASLSAVIDLPVQTDGQPGPGGKRRRRRNRTA